jgi:hypothetical protein
MLEFILGMVCGAIVIVFVVDFYIAHLVKTDKELWDYIDDNFGKGDR